MHFYLKVKRAWDFFHLCFKNILNGGGGGGGLGGGGAGVFFFFFFFFSFFVFFNIWNFILVIFVYS